MSEATKPRPPKKKTAKKKARKKKAKVHATTVVGATELEVSMAKPHKGGTLKNVTFDQYETGYQLFMGLPPGPRKMKALMEGAKLTGAQVTMLTKSGHKKAKPQPWPAWNDRLTAEVLELQRNACDVARDLSKTGVQLFKLAMGNTQRAQVAVASILGVMAHRLSVNMKLPDGQRMPVEKVMPGAAVRDTLACLRPYADLSHLGRAFQEIYGSPHKGKGSPAEAPDALFVDLSGDYGMRGAFAFAGIAGGEEAEAADVLDELMPEMAGWTDEEIAHFAKTGQRPELKAVSDAG